MSSSMAKSTLFILVGIFSFAHADSSSWSEGGARFLLQLLDTSGESCVLMEPSPGGLQGTLVSCAEVAHYPTVQASKLQGYEAKRFLRLDAEAVTDAMVSNTELTAANFKELMALIGGSSTHYLKSQPGGGALLPSFSGAPSSFQPGQIWYDAQARTVKFYDGSSLQDLKATKPNPSCGIQMIVAGPGLTGGKITSSGTIALENFGTPGTYYKVTTDSHGRVQSGATSLTEADLPVIVTPGKVSGNALTSGTIGGSTSLNTSGQVTAATVSATNIGAKTISIYNTGNSQSVSLTSPVGLSASYGLVWPAALPTVAGQMLTADTKGNLSWTTPGTGSTAPATVVSGQAPIVVTGTATAPTVSVSSATTSTLGVVTLAPAGGTAAGTVVQGNDPRLVDGRAPSGAASGDLTGAYPAPVVAGLRGVPLATTTAGDDQWLKFAANANTWSPAFVGLADLKNVTGTSQVPANCSAAQTLVYSSALDQFTCVSIGIPYTSVSGLGNAATENVGTAAGTVAAGNDARFGNAVQIQGRNISTVAPAPAQVLTWDPTNNWWSPATPAVAPVQSVAGRTGNVVLAVGDIGGLGTAATYNVASSGNAAAAQVVLGTDTRLKDARVPLGPAGGDLTGSYPNPNLIAIGTAGTYAKVTTDANGRVIAGAPQLSVSDIPNLPWAIISSGLPTTLTGYGITDAVQNAGGTPSIQTGADAAKGNAGTAGRLYVASDTFKIYSDNGSAWMQLSPPTAASGGTVTSITAGNGLLGGTITASGTIAANAGTGANQLVQLNGTGQLPPVDGTLLAALNANSLTTGTLPAARMPALSGDVNSNAGGTTVSVVKLQGVPVTSTTPVNGSYLKFNGGAWMGSAVTLADLKSTVAGNLFPAPNCTAAQTLVWTSVTDQFSCIGIAIRDAAITYGSEAASTFLAAPVAASGAPTFRAISPADLPPGAYDASYFKNGGNTFGGAATLGTLNPANLQIVAGGTTNMTFTPAGNVGVGTPTPTAALDVHGSVRVGNDTVCNSSKQGAISWNGSAFQGCNGTAWVPLASTTGTAVKPAYAYQINSTDTLNTGLIPWVNTAPTTAQGNEVLTATITPTSATSLIEVHALVHFSATSLANSVFTLAAFQNSTTSAFASAASNMTTTNCGPASDTPFMCQAVLSTVFPAGTTGPIVIHIRAGPLTGNWELNGASGQRLGGTLASTLILREVLQ